ncbi:uncharacterized protein A1O9_04048 [Exophiala aquamarina CBS 119918]|uniref:Uncharacterized protein n=1 Tax=Exophiala aquamarina CBS 119918 TaxID=1182545 RepID=A0A072PGF5_9EURO|nr:uncharacterized protein A1O9_04048 [Exophiala aquamarina CBS 119918]KEF59204.1 hypothetical protein A1O9_04048 [Exophiala aquamarina CBS 119918]
MQLEIGIDALSDNFGPQTLSALDARSGIGDSDCDDLVQIVQYAFYCKGYDTGGNRRQPGRRDDQGCNTDVCERQHWKGTDVKTLKPKVLKALLAWTLTRFSLEVNEVTRKFQSWLNSRYLAIENFCIIPVDGPFSREGQKALYLAIQSEMRLNDDHATGSFGSLIETFIRSHSLGVGVSRPLAQILTGAMICQCVKTAVGGDLFQFADRFD